MAPLKSFALTMAHNMRVPNLLTSAYHGAYHMKPQLCITHNPMDLPRHASSPVKHALQGAKYSGANPHLALLALPATPIDSKLPSPAELLYQCRLRTTILAKIHNSDPSAIHICEQINTCSKVAKAQGDTCSKTLVPLYAGQPVATYDTLQKIWVPATVIHILPWNSYQVCTSNGSTYHCTWRHLHECSVKTVNTAPSGTTTTLQALTRHHFSAVQPALPPSAPCMQPMPAAPATPANQMNQAPAVLTMPAVQYPSTDACNIPCHTCAATKIQPCPHGTKMPDPGNLGTIDPDCPQTLFLSCTTIYIPSQSLL